VVCAPKTQREKIWENDGMDNADAVLQELETHVQRIIEHYDPKNPHAKILNVTDMRGNPNEQGFRHWRGIRYTGGLLHGHK
jgi:hypothetical protein